MARDLTAAQRVALARDPGRTSPLDYVQGLFTDFFEQRGDRLFGDDAAIVGGIARFHGQPVSVICTRKGKNLEENLNMHFGMPERLTVPMITVICGEGGSGGALALAMGNRVLMLENAVYSVLSPEGFASILWKDSSRVEEACEVMKLTAQDLLELGVIDEIIPEPENADSLGARLRIMDGVLTKQLDAVKRLKDPARHRQEKFAAMGGAWIRGGNT